MSEKGVFIFSSWYDIIKDLPNDDFSELAKAIIEFGIARKTPTFSNRGLNLAFKLIAAELERYEDKGRNYSETQSNNGRKGGAPVGNQNAKKQPKTTETTQNNRNKLDKDIDIDIDKEKDIDKDKEKEKEKDLDSSSIAAVESIVNFFNSICCFGQVEIPLSDKRLSSIKDIVNKYGEKKAIEAINMAEKSDFLRGGGSNGWKLTFDWLFDDNNFPKVLSGNYSNKERNTSGKIGTNFENW